MPVVSRPFQAQDCADLVPIINQIESPWQTTEAGCRAEYAASAPGDVAHHFVASPGGSA
jgi:hypothetical protein